MSTFKRCISLLMAMLILVGVFAPAAQAAPAEETATVNTDGVTVEGTNGFGNLLSQGISQSQAEAEEEAADFSGGYSVTDLEIENGVATVTYDSMEEATLVVALYTEDGMRMVNSAKATVTPDATEVTVTFEGEMPEYFLASAYIVDGYDLSPLCAAYDTPMYTREMQELLASTVDDYDPEKVLNLDEDETTNFAVYADSTIVIEAVEGVNTVASIDDENAAYVIENADEQFTSLSAGNIFVYPYAEGEILVVKVATIAIDGTTVTITGAEIALEEAFAAVKIEGGDDTENMVVDESTLDEDTSFEGISAPENSEQMMPMDNEVSAGASKSAKFQIDKDVLSKGNAKVNIAGSLEFSVALELSYYISATRQHVEFRIDKTVTGAFTITGSVEFNWKLCKAAFYPIPGLDIAIEPTLTLKVSGKIQFFATLTGTIGFTYNGKGAPKSLNSTPKLELDVKAECTIFFGVDMKPQIEIAEGYLAEFEIELPIGVEFVITGTGNDGAAPDESEPVYHTCSSCLDVEVFTKLEITVKLQFLKCKWLKIEAKVLELRRGWGHMYYSFDHSRFGFGLCPYQTYRLTVTVKDDANAAVPDANVTVESETQKTNGKGNVVFYLPEGIYTVTATDGELSVDRQLILTEAEKLVIELSDDELEDRNNTLLDASDALMSDIVDMERVLDQPLAVFNGHTYTLFDGEASNWDAAQEYCEALGAHLLTITSAEENAFVYDYMIDCGYTDAYWGLTDRETEGVWEWCTGEPLTYVNWAEEEPNNDNGGEHYGMFWEGEPGGVWNDGDFGHDGVAFLCEWDRVLTSAKAVRDNHAYLLIYTDVNSWEEAQSYCESLGGHLATITSAEENEFVYSYVVASGSRNAYFGMTDKNREGTWEWCTGEEFSYSNWAPDQPSDSVGEENYGMYWDNYSNGEWNDGSFDGNHPFICEWDNAADSVIMSDAVLPDMHQPVAPNAVYPGDYGTEVTDTYTLKTASFKELVPGEQYVLLAMASIEVEDPLTSDNLLFIDQAAAAEDGTLAFEYVQRTPCDISYVMVCGASHKNLKDAEITFPEMTADGDLQVVDPVVVYDGKTLREGRDYVIVGKVDFTEAGEYTCYIRGIHNYTGLVECAYRVTEKITENPFGDVGTESFFYEPVMWALRNNITTGTSETTFSPEAKCVRAQVVTFLWRAVGCPDPAGTVNPFVDVKPEDFYYKPVLWALENGITTGVSATHFGAMDNCNRAQVVTFLYRALDNPGVGATDNPFTDVEKGSFYEGAVLWAVENGITTGLSATQFGPGAICNRAQVVTFLYRAFANM